jgi:hypothetical protein
MIGSKPDIIIAGLSTDIVLIMRIVYKLIISEEHNYILHDMPLLPRRKKFKIP